MYASSHLGDTTIPSSLLRFNDYTNGLRKEFELHSKATQRFDIYLGNLKGEFELMALDTESLQKERDAYKQRAEAQAKELQHIRNRRYFVCERFNKRKRDADAIPPFLLMNCIFRLFSSWLKTRKTALSSSMSVFQPKALEKSGEGVVQSYKTTPHRPTRHSTLIRKVPQVPTQPSHSTYLNTIVTQSKVITLPSRPSEPSAIEIGDKKSITYNNKVKKELDMEMVHVFFHRDWVNCVKFSRDGKYLAAGCDDGKVYIYNTKKGKLTSVLRNLLTERDQIYSVLFSSDGRYLATGVRDGTIYIWEIRTKYVRNAFKGHTSLVYSFDFSQNDRLLVSASADNTVRLWNIRYGAVKVLTDANHTHGGHDGNYFYSAVFSPDEMHVAASHCDGMLRLWDVCTGQLVRRVKCHTDWMLDVAFMPDGKGLVSGSFDGTLKYWDVSSLYTPRSRGNLRTVNDPPTHLPMVEEQTQPQREFLGHTRGVHSFSVSPDGLWVASGSRDHTVRIWDTRNAAMQCVIENGSCVRTVDFSRSRRYLAAGGISGLVTIWRYSYT